MSILSKKTNNNIILIKQMTHHHLMIKIDKKNIKIYVGKKVEKYWSILKNLQITRMKNIIYLKR